MPDYLDTDHGEGYLDCGDYDLFYRRYGHGDDVLLGVHGGPGMPHDYLLPLADHASDDLTVYLYDQFGVGRSDDPAPGDFDRYTVDHYRDEIETIRQTLDPSGFHLYGQSWGGMIAQEYALEHGDHLDSLILANTLTDSQTAYESMRRVLDDLPDTAQATIEEYEANRAFDAPEYDDALDQAYREHVCRFDEYPDPVAHTFDNIAMDVYGLMWGPNEYVLHDTARLRNWDIREAIPAIDVPTLVLTGRYDEISPDIARDIADRIPTADLVEFDDSSHMPFWEQPDHHYETVQTFLTDHLTSQ